MEPIQITLPKSKKTVSKSEVAIGIDFGTTHSVVAVSNNKQVHIIEDSNHHRLIPSVVAIRDQEFIIGNEAKSILLEKNITVIHSIKRLIGKGIDDLTEEYEHFQAIIDQKNSSKEYISITTKDGKNFSTASISSKILAYLKQLAEVALKQNITKAVITVPAHFNEHQRNAVKYAAETAQLEVLRILNEPTAAAIAYGLDKNTEGNYIIYDFGGGTFDVSILQMNKGIFKVIATNGDTNLGGDDIDYLIAKHIKTTLKQHSFTEIELLAKARTLKELLSQQEEASITINKHTVSLGQESFNDIIRPLIDKTIKITLDTLDDSNLEDVIDGILLVGGSSRIPLITKKLKEKLPKIPLYQDINPDEVVARGAALQAESLVHGSSHLLLDVNPLSLGIELADGINERIIERNTTIPTSVTKAYTTYKDNQTGMIFNIIQGERELAKDCRSIGKLELTKIPPMKAGAPRINITFSLDADNLLTVKAEEQLTKTKQQIELLPSYKLEMQDVEDMLYDSIEHAQDDIDKKIITKAVFKATSIIDQALNSINEDSELLSTKEKDKIEKQCDAIKQAIKTQKTSKIDQELELLEKTMIKFNTKKINKYVNIGLKGANISDLKNN